MPSDRLDHLAAIPREHWKMIDALRAGERAMLVELCAADLLPSRDADLDAQRHRA